MPGFYRRQTDLSLVPESVQPTVNLSFRKLSNPCPSPGPAEQNLYWKYCSEQLDVFLFFSQFILY